jgi:hypothetical protein
MSVEADFFEKVMRLLERPPLGTPVGSMIAHKELRFTAVDFGAAEDVAGKCLPVIERNERGDCLCLAGGGRYLVDVHFRDVMMYLSRDLKTGVCNTPRFRRFVVDDAGACRMERTKENVN